MHAQSLHWCPSLCDPVDYSSPDSSVHGILQTRLLEWVALPSQVSLGFPGSSAGKESAYNAGDTSLIPRSGSSPGEGIGYPLQDSGACHVDQTVKESACNVGDLGSIPGLGRPLGGGHGNPLHYSCLENPLGQRSLAGYSPGDRKQSDMTEQLSIAQHGRGITKRFEPKTQSSSATSSKK